MRIRLSRVGSAAVSGALMVLISYSAQAAPPTPRPETTLLGVRLGSSFSAVLRKFGQPTEIQVGQPTVTPAAQGGAGAVAGLPGGGPGRGMLPGMPGMPGMMPGMGGPAMGVSGGPPPGSMYAQGGRGMGGAPMMGGPPMGVSGGPPPGSMYGMQGRRGMMGPMGGGPAMGMSGPPPGMMPGGVGGLPGMGMSGMPGYGPGGLTAANGAQQGVPGVETTWWYHYPKDGLHYSFLFDRKGRVIQIQAYGYKPSAKVTAPRTAEGITLGTPLGQVIRRYGWSNDGDNAGDYIVLRYGAPDQIAFQSRHNQVVGIVLGLVR